MRYLLSLVLTLLPFDGHPADSIPLPPHGIGMDQTTMEGSIAETPSGDEQSVDQLWPYANPYHPASPTNFDIFTGSLSPLSDGNGRSRLSQYLSRSALASAVYGHVDSPFFPDSISQRNETGHPYPLDSPSNHYGRSWRMERQ